MRSKKGAIVDTAIIAGTHGGKAHPRSDSVLPSAGDRALRLYRSNSLTPTELAIRCEVAISHKTGVEMEALTGATVAALTVYDMCKALSHEIVIADVHLLEKSGGKRLVRKGRAAKK